jgi:arylsulfatase A-like enzyme
MPLTAPAHATMMTGLYPPEHGVIENAALLMGGVDILADRLQKAGYATTSVVGVTFLAEYGMERGFDVVDRGFDKGYERHADRVTDAATAHLDQAGDKPLLLWAHYYDPHNPYRPPPQFLPILREQGVPQNEDDWRKVETRLRSELHSDYAGPDARTFLLNQYAYDGEIEFMDAQVGRLLDHLKASGRYDDALVIIVGDHGEAFGEHPGDVMHGTRLYETTMHVPWMIKLPGQREGRVTDALVSLIDLMPTVLDVLELPVPARCSGKSLVPLLHGEPPPWDAADRVVFMQRRLFRRLGPAPTQPAASQASEFDVEMVAARGPRWKLIWQSDGTRELYDLQNDPAEAADLSAAHAEELDRLEKQLMVFREEMEKRGRATEPVLTSESLEMLKALGYVGDH